MMIGKAGKTITVAPIVNYLINICHEVCCIVIIPYIIILLLYRQYKITFPSRICIVVNSLCLNSIYFHVMVSSTYVFWSLWESRTYKNAYVCR